MDDILKKKGMTKQKSSNLFEKRNKLSEIEDDKKDENNNKNEDKQLYENKEDDKKEEKDDKPEKPFKKELKRFKTENLLETKGGSDRLNRLSKRLMRSKEQAKKREEENAKLRKSDNITKRASLLEGKLNIGTNGPIQPIEKIQEETNEDQ